MSERHPNMQDPQPEPGSVGAWIISPTGITILGAIFAVLIVSLIVYEIRDNRRRGRAFEEQRKPPKRLP